MLNQKLSHTAVLEIDHGRFSELVMPWYPEVPLRCLRSASTPTFARRQ